MVVYTKFGTVDDIKWVRPVSMWNDIVEYELLTHKKLDSWSIECLYSLLSSEENSEEETIDIPVIRKQSEG